MSPFAILLRIMLCIGLVLNGSGYAIAATQMQHTATVSEHTRAAAVTGQDAAAPPCHDRSGMAGVAPDMSTAANGDTGNDPSEPEHSIPDCCKSSNCAGACLQHAFAAMPGLPAGSIVTDHASSVRPMRTGHPAPALPHLIRPPIG